jgi:glycosyltransferase involved in cell wall biosynthesis
MNESEGTAKSNGRPVHVCFVAVNILPVLMASAVPFAGGAEVQQTILAQALRARGYRVSVLTRDPTGHMSSHVEKATADGIEIHVLPSEIGRGIRGLRRIHPRLTDIVRRLRGIDPDVVYFRCASGLLAACAWYARRYGKRVVFAAAHDNDFRPGRIFGLERRELWLFRQSLRWCDAILVQNRAQQELQKARFRRDGLVIPNCFEERQSFASDAAGPVLWVGTVKPAKRPELFVELASSVPARRFVMIGGAVGGTGADLDYAREVEARARAVSNLAFLGFVPFSRVGSYFDGAAALINTSESEGFPNTFLQAWIRGIPTLSFVAPVTNQESTGTIVCRSFGDMKDRLVELLKTEEAWYDASDRVCKYFARFHSIEAVLPSYGSVFRAP